jgi:hypothetical protein
MLPTTVDAVKALLKADPSLTPSDRTHIVGAVRNHGRPTEPQPTPVRQGARILTRAEVAKRFGRTLRFVDTLSAQGVLRRVTLPGRIRSCGFREADVEQLLSAERDRHAAD